MKEFSMKELKAEIISKYGSVENLKSSLKRGAVYEYGGRFTVLGMRYMYLKI